ncbi:MAG: hypothetical protein OHK0029_11580 [Armatimonadaceae bacterium]
MSEIGTKLDGEIPFPTVRWKREWATFVATGVLPAPAIPQPAALVFPFYGDRVVLADIATRGWCIPSGHIEPGESPEDAVRREAFEEAGVELGTVLLLGYFILTDTETGAVRHAPTYIGSVHQFGEIPDGTESNGRQLVPVEAVADMYFAWDPLLAAVFEFADEMRRERLSSGTALSALIGN